MGKGTKSPKRNGSISEANVRKRRRKKANKSKVRPVSSWCYQRQRQAFSMKALQRVVWSLIFLVFGVHMGNAEEQGIQVQERIEKDLCPTLPSRLPMEEDALLEEM